MFSLEALTLTLLCQFVCFHLFSLYDVKLAFRHGKQLICVQPCVLNLYGFYFVYFSLLVVSYILIFSECVLMSRNLSVILEEYGGLIFFSFSPFAPSCVLANFYARTVLGLSMPRNM